jgi:pyruvyl transferase EpsO
MLAATPRTSHPDLQLITDLQTEIGRVFGPLVDGIRHVALVDFPGGSNVGDNAMWLGVLSYLAAKGIAVEYVCDPRTYSRQQLARRIGDGTILLTGGGNFGDLYPYHDALRVALVQDFPHNRIVQLPQTLFFRHAENLEKTGTVLRQHTDFTVLARDRASLDIATNRLRVSARLCPDMAFCLGPLARTWHAEYDIVMIKRQDQESQRALPRTLGRSVLRVDWRSPSFDPSLFAYRTLARAEKHLGLGALLHPISTGLTRPVAERQLGAGLKLLSAGREVWTDRLHGHILCVLLGISHLFMDNSYGKNSGFFQTWTSRSRLTRWLDANDSRCMTAATA